MSCVPMGKIGWSRESSRWYFDETKVPQYRSEFINWMEVGILDLRLGKYINRCWLQGNPLSQ